MLFRIRFKTDPEDPRPVNWPVTQPYWISGFAGDGSRAYVVTYADSVEYVKRNWPDAEDIDIISTVERHEFTDRFPRPKWWTGGEDAQARDET